MTCAFHVIRIDKFSDVVIIVFIAAIKCPEIKFNLVTVVSTDDICTWFAGFRCNGAPIHTPGEGAFDLCIGRSPDIQVKCPNAANVIKDFVILY